MKSLLGKLGVIFVITGVILIINFPKDVFEKAAGSGLGYCDLVSSIRSWPSLIWISECGLNKKRVISGVRLR